jgi:hypothetical protein
MRKRRFIVVSVLYALVLPLIYVFVSPLAALAISAIMLVSVLAALWLARHQSGNAVATPKPLSERERRIYGLARRGVLIGAVVSLMTWAFVWSFYWELRSYFLLPSLISCVIVALAIYGVLRPSSLSNNVMRFQLRAAFGYSLVLPVFVAWVLIARFTGIDARGTGVVFIPLSIWVGFFIQRWRERSVVAGTVS